MNEFKIKKLKAKNFLCFGENGIEIDFENKGNIILLQGRNLDNIPETEEDKLCSNGVGKSSIGDAIVFALTGKTIRKFKRVEQVINNSAGKGLTVELYVDNYKIVRTRSSTSTLKVYDLSKEKDGKPLELTKGTMDETQNFIENVLGFNASHQSLINLLILTDNNKGSFLEADTPEKRKMVENYLQLEQYAEYSKSASAALKDAKNIIKELQKEVERSEIYYEDSVARLESNQESEKTWKQNKKIELDVLISKFKNKQTELSSFDNSSLVDAYNNAQEEIKTHYEKISTLENNNFQTEIENEKNILENFNKEKNEIDLKIQDIKKNTLNNKSLIDNANKQISNLESMKCKNCGFYDENNVLKNKEIIASATEEIKKNQLEFVEINNKNNELIEKISNFKNSIKEKELNFSNIKKEIDSLRIKINNLSKIQKPEMNAQQQVLEEQLKQLKNQILLKKQEYEGESPYIKIIEKDKVDVEKNKNNLESKKLELDKSSEILPYYEFWVKAFGEQGIRKFVIDGIIPTLNNRINYWLNYLIDNKIKLEFDNELNEKIERNPSDGDEYVYSAMSGGERRRLNLAVSQAFSYITTLTTGSCPSLVFLDEVATNIDQVGVANVFNMIKELSKERQVIVTTHDKALLEFLDGVDVINLVKKGGITTII